MSNEIDLTKYKQTTSPSKGILAGIKKQEKSKAGRKKKAENEKLDKVPLYLTKDEIEYIEALRNKELPTLKLSPYIRHKMQQAGLIRE